MLMPTKQKCEKQLLCRIWHFQATKNVLTFKQIYVYISFVFKTLKNIQVQLTIQRGIHINK